MTPEQGYEAAEQACVKLAGEIAQLIGDTELLDRPDLSIEVEVGDSAFWPEAFFVAVIDGHRFHVTVTAADMHVSREG